MAVVLGNRAKMSTSTTGTGTITLGSALSGYQTFAQAGITNGQTVRYAIEDGTNFEIGSGVYTSSGTTLTRNVTESSNSDNAINLSGSGEVFITASAADIFVNDGANSLTTTGVITGGTVEATSDTAAGDNAAMGYTSAEGLILTGQGSTNDITIKNDADTAVISIPTGGTNVDFVGSIDVANVGISTGVIDLKNSGSQSVVKFYCESSNAHYAEIKAPAHGSFSGNVTLTLPATTDTIAGIAATQTFTNKTLTSPVLNTGSVGTSLAFPDNAKALFGAGSDLQIYHNATHSYIDNNTGNIYIRSNVDDDDGGNIVLEAKAGENGIIIADDGDVSLHFNGNSKLATTNTGVAITGDVVASGTVEPAGDTAAGDNAAIGYTAAEGLILTGQGSTSDITLKNDADAVVFTVPTGTDDILFPDNAKAMFGAGSDLQIYHDGSDGKSYIRETGSGNFEIRATNLRLKDATGGNYLAADADGAVTAYYDGSPKLATTSTGIAVTGDVIASGTVEPAGDTAAGDNAAVGYTSAEGLILTGQGSTSDITFKNDADAVVFSIPTGTDDILFPDNAKAMFGAGSDLQIFHDGTNSLIDDTDSGFIAIRSDTMVKLLKRTGNENMVVAVPDGAVTLYHDNAAKIATTATGVEVTGAATVGGAAVKVAGKESIYVPAAAMYPSTTNPCSDLTQVETTALRPDLKVLDFAAAADDFAQFTIAFPKSWNEGTITFQPFWTVTGTNTGTVAWQLAAIAVSNDDSINTAFGTQVATTALAFSGTSNDLMVSAESGAVTIAGSPAANDMCFFQINRDTSADDQSGAARLVGLKLFFTTDAANDA
jgi:hypothetical protein